MHTIGKGNSKITMIRPAIGYVSSMWDPYQATLPKEVEQVQLIAAGFYATAIVIHPPVLQPDYYTNLNRIPSSVREHIQTSPMLHV